MSKIETIGVGRFLRLRVRDGWEYVERPNIRGIAVIVAVTDDAKLLLVEQYRASVDRRVTSLPAGLVGDLPGQEDEDLAVGAIRELEEETGYRAERMEPLVAGPPSVGSTSEVATFMRARGLRKVSAGGGDEYEDIAVHEVPLAEAPRWLEQQAGTGRLVDPKTYAGLYFALHDDD